MRLSQKRTKPLPSPESRHSGRERERFRTRKKQKRLDAIRDHVIEPIDRVAEGSGTVDSDGGLLRRSTRVRRAPVIVDFSPSPPKRKPRIGNAGGITNSKSKGSVDKKKGKSCVEKVSPGGSVEAGNWESRLRSRDRNVNVIAKEKVSPTKGKRKCFHELDGSGEESRLIGRKEDQRSGEFDGTVLQGWWSRRIARVKESRDEKSIDLIIQSSGKKGSTEEGTLKERLSHSVDEIPCPSKDANDGENERATEDGSAEEKENEGREVTAELQLDIDKMSNKELEAKGQGTGQLDQSNGEVEEKCSDATRDDPKQVNVEKETIVSAGPRENESGGDVMDAHPDELDISISENKNAAKLDKLKSVTNDVKLERPRIREGRRCGLCGGGTDGKPPKRLIRDAADSDNEAYGGSSSSEEPNYDVWDGFGDEPGWLGRLLGPIHDRFGIAGIWVHQHCAVWSPEVYFAGLGCLKNVRAALCRGRALKCSRCGRPGATIGCRVDRCPKTYHLPCARAEGCIFDHRKFLIACTDHRHLFQLQGNDYIRHIKKLKAKKMRLEIRKLSSDASRKDLEAEEKWLENCGEDEEFLKREGKRLHRDISRIAPVYIGGPFAESEKSYQGWESVAGLQDVIQCMKEVVILPLLYPEFFTNLRLTPPRGVLLHGYPGTGKTLVVRALIGACSHGDKRIAYFARKGADCLGKYVGDAERQLRLLFQVAERSQPSIIFFDEIDGLAPVRSKQQDQTHSSVVSTLLALMDGLKSRGSVIVIGATNRPEAVDPALRRPGRFDREIYFPLPSLKDRAAILSLHTQSWPKPLSGSLLIWIAEQTAGFAGADLQALCTQAAMIALKRNCALQKLLSTAEKYPGHGRRLSLPSFVVDERDWLAALACAPPPCSRREAGMAANDVVSSPLPPHLVPCLLQPLTQLLISLYHDERIQLPPAIYKAAKLINNVITSILEQKKIHILCWSNYLPYLMQQSEVVKEIERSLSHAGLLIGSLSFLTSDPVTDDTCGDHEKLEIYKQNPCGAQMHRNSIRRFSFSGCKTSGFRVLIAGSPRSGQRHLAACLLQGFVGHQEIQKVNLATISQEGRGDMIEGITRILLKCSRVGCCMIYMPRIDLWAMHETRCQTNKREISLCPKTSKSLKAGQADAADNTSEAWNSFIEQVESMGVSSSFIILATCEMPTHVLPSRVKQFFAIDILSSTSQSSSQHTIPRFFMHVDGTFNRDLVFSSSAEKISRDLVKQYVQLIHHGTHTDNADREIENCDAVKVYLEVRDQTTENGATTGEMDLPTESARIDSNIGGSSKVNQSEQLINSEKRWSPVFKISLHEEDHVSLHSHQDSISRIPPSRALKGKHYLLSTIATFGYQILRYPHFAELCWATSKLKEGPCTGIDGPWKGWPFNSCFIRANNSVEKEAIGCSSSNPKNRVHSDVVRGLVAIGLLAYKGVYRSVTEVSLEVRKVLELLVEEINAKIQSGKDRYRFLRLLSQVAYLEDLVSSWVYASRSLELESQVLLSNARPMIVGSLDTDNQACEDVVVGNDMCMQTISSEKQQEVKSPALEENLTRFAREDGEYGHSNKEVTHLGLSNSDMNGLSTEVGPAQMVSLAPSPPGILQSSTPASGSFACPNTSNEVHNNNHLEVHSSKNPVPCLVFHEEFGLPEESSGFMATATVSHKENMSDLDDSSFISKSRIANDNCGYGSSQTDAVVSSEAGDHNPNGTVGIINSNIRKSIDLPSQSESLCLYNCCHECLQTVHALIQEVITKNWESNGCCSTVDDVHDVVETCSASLLAAISKSFVAGSYTASGVLHGRNLQHGTCDKHCACQCLDDNWLKNTSWWLRCEGKREVMPIECICHSNSKDVKATDTCKNAVSVPELKLSFRDCVLVSPERDKDAVSHCKFENLCLCSTIEKILMIKQPLD